MLKVLSTSALAFAVSFGAIAALPTAASAQQLELRLGRDGVPRIEQRDDRPYDGERRPRHRDRCGADEAESAARDEGLHRPRVVRMTDRSVIVEGYRHGQRERMRFANERGCPSLD